MSTAIMNEDDGSSLVAVIPEERATVSSSRHGRRAIDKGKELQATQGGKKQCPPKQLGPSSFTDIMLKIIFTYI